MYGIPGYEHAARPRAAKAESGKRSAGLNYEDGLISATPSIEREDDGATERILDLALEHTFPASDPLSITQPGFGRQVKSDSNCNCDLLTPGAREWEDVASEVLSDLALADTFPLEEQPMIRQPRLRQLVQITRV